MRTQTKPSIRAQLVHLSFVIVVVSIALSLAGTLYFALRSEQTALDNNLLNSASILSQMPMLRETLRGELSIDELADYLDDHPPDLGHRSDPGGRYRFHPCLRA